MRQNLIIGNVDYGSKVPDLTWEEELLLRGVRPDSDLVPVIQKSIASPQNRCKTSHNNKNTSFYFTIKQGVAGGDVSNRCLVKNNHVGSSQVMGGFETVSPLKNISARVNKKGTLTFSDCGSVIDCFSDCGQSSTTRSLVRPTSFVSPRVVVSSLNCADDDAKVPSPHNTRAGLAHGGLLPPLDTSTLREARTASTAFTAPQQGDRKLGRLTPLRSPINGAIPIRETEATLKTARSSGTQQNCLMKENIALRGGGGGQFVANLTKCFAGGVPRVLTATRKGCNRCQPKDRKRKEDT